MRPAETETRRRSTLASGGDWDTSVQWVRLEEGGIIHLFACARPESDQGPFESQAESMYENLRMILEEHGATPADVMTETLFCTDVDRQYAVLESLRRSFYELQDSGCGQAPSATFLRQPPCVPGRRCELQAKVMLHQDGSPVAARRLRIPGGGAGSGMVVHSNGYDHVYLSNLTGAGDAGGGSGFVSQTRSMFERAEECLRRQGLTFGNVIRTWFYLRDMEEDYAAFNDIRNRFYRERGVGLLPASTGIQGAVFPTDRRCGMDLYALGGRGAYEMRVMHSPTMNDPPAYKSAFSRGIHLGLNDSSFVYVSGTASINTGGEIVHVGDIEGQVQRMLHNIEQLLAGQGVGFDDVLSAVTYLKEGRFLEAFQRVCARYPELQQAVNTVVVADVCRPEWLCEMELMAIGP
ncbi:MAG: RidA family protein [Acidobacteriota bacterium]